MTRIREEEDLICSWQSANTQSSPDTRRLNSHDVPWHEALPVKHHHQFCSVHCRDSDCGRVTTHFTLSYY